MVSRPMPDLSYEDRYRHLGTVAGIDEAGRGPLAGPVVAAAAVLPPGFINFGITDSKLLSEKKREEFYSRIMEEGIITAVGIVNHQVIDQINILQATHLAMRKALSRLPVDVHILLIDGLKLPGVKQKQEKVIKGDQKVLSISVASIVAKVTRDRIMKCFDEIYPGYGFASHKGYPTKSHREAIKKLGVTSVHRRTFGPVAECL